MSEFEFWDELGNIFNAIVAYQHKTIEFNKRFVNPWLKLGTVFDQADNNADALLASRKAIEIDKENGENWLSLGDVYFKMGSFDDAGNAYAKAIELNPNLGWAYANLALTNVTRQKYTEAVNLYVKSLELIDDDQDRAMIWNRLGNVYRKVNDYENAFIAFQMADECDEHNTGFDDQLDEVTVEQKVMPIVAEVFVRENNASVDGKPVVVKKEAVEHSDMVTINDETIDVADSEGSDQDGRKEIEAVVPMTEGDSPLDVDEPVGDDFSDETPDDDQILEETLLADEAEPVVENVEVDTLIDENINEDQQPASITEEKVVEEWLSDDADESPDEAFADEKQLGETVVDSTDDLQTEVSEDLPAVQGVLETAELDDVSSPSIDDDSSQPELAEDPLKESVVEPNASSDDSPVSEILITEEIKGKGNVDVQLQVAPEVQSVAVESDDEVAEISVEASIEVTDQEDQPALISNSVYEFVSEDVGDEINMHVAPTDDLDEENAIGDLSEAEEVVELNSSEEIEPELVSLDPVEDVESDENLQENNEEVKSDTVSVDDVQSEVPVLENDDAEDAQLESASESSDTEVMDDAQVKLVEHVEASDDSFVEVQENMESEVDLPSMLSPTDAVESSEPDAGNTSLEADMTPVMSHGVETFADPSGENQPVVLAIEDLAELLEQQVTDENIEGENNADDTGLQFFSESEAPEDVSEPVMDENVQADVEAEKDDVAEVVAEITALADKNNKDASIVDETGQLRVSEETESEVDDNSAYEEFIKHAVEPVLVSDDAIVSKSGYSVMNDLSVEPDTKNAHVWNELGNVYFNTGAYNEAIAAYSKAIELDDWFAWPYSNLALVYVQKEKYAEAILLYQRGIELFSSDTDKAITWNRLGNVYRRLSDYDNAISCYQRADELDPNNATRSLRSRFSLLGSLNIEQSPSVAA